VATQTGDTKLGSPISTANAINSIVEQTDASGVSKHIVNAIQSAANKTGVNFSFLMQKASQESSFDPSAKASTSSATGLFQFTSQTWLHMIKTYGEEYGLGNYASQITKGADGHLSVENSAARQAILALRKDPRISAEMAGELDKENSAALERKVGGKIGATELYLAHFLGATGASRFIKAMRSTPNASAAELLPTAASANRSAFYDKAGNARSLQQVYQKYAQKFEPTTFTQTAELISEPSVSTDFSVSNGPISVNLAKLLPRETAATTKVSSLSDETDIFGLKTNDWGTAVASSHGSSLLDAMIMGQVQDSGLTTMSPLAAYNQQADNKKKNGASTRSSIV